MTVYFTASVVGKKHFLSNYEHIVKHLKKKGHTVISDHIIYVTEQQIHLKSQKERVNFHKKLEKWINSCDFMVVEASFPSMSVGYEISLAMQRGKPVLLLYSKGEPPSLFAYHEDEKLVPEKYTNENLPQILDDFTNYVKGVHGSRFTFYITSELSAHLKKQAKKKNLPKSVYLRQLIEKDLRDRS